MTNSYHFKVVLRAAIKYKAWWLEQNSEAVWIQANVIQSDRYGLTLYF